MAITLGPGEQRLLNVQLTPVPPDPARLYGRVTNSQTGGGVAGAVVQITGTGGGYQGVTNSTGNYDIPGITPGTYDGMVTHPDYETAYF